LSTSECVRLRGFLLTITSSLFLERPETELESGVDMIEK